MRLIKIHGGGNVLWNEVIGLPGFRDAIHLDRQQHGNPNAIELASQQHYGGASPTVAKQDDAGVGLFLLAEGAIVIAVEQLKNGFVSILAMTILKDLDKSVRAERAPHALGQQNRLLVRIVVTHEAADEAHKDVGRSSGMQSDSSLGRKQEGRRRKKNRDGSK